MFVVKYATSNIVVVVVDIARNFCDVNVKRRMRMAVTAID